MFFVRVDSKMLLQIVAGLKELRIKDFIFSFRSQPRGPSSFSVAKKNQNATAAPAAMKVSGLANGVIAAPVNAEGTVIKGLCKRGGE